MSLSHKFAHSRSHKSLHSATTAAVLVAPRPHNHILRKFPSPQKDHGSMASSASDQQHPSHVYKILSQEQWTAWDASGAFTGAGIDVQDGYIHLSTSEQVVATYDKFFKDKLDEAGAEIRLVLATVDLTKVKDPVRWEVSRGGALFPHVYGRIERDAVVAVAEGWKGEQPDA